jgi:UPF0271 protein
LDLNADLGESFGSWTMGEDAAMFQLVTSANVACGFHAGDPVTMLDSCRAAYELDVTVGAHVGYRDLAGFGRRSLDMSFDELFGDVLYQLGALDGVAHAVGASVDYVKPHGALYNRLVHDAGQASAVVAAVNSYDPGLPILGLPGSELLKQAEEAGHPVFIEAFVDRAYQADGTLVPRSQEGAVLHEVNAIVERAVRLARDRGEGAAGLAVHPRRHPGGGPDGGRGPCRAGSRRGPAGSVRLTREACFDAQVRRRTPYIRCAHGSARRQHICATLRRWRITTVKIARPAKEPTTVPLIRMNCRSLPTWSSIFCEVSSASQRATVSVITPAMSER